MCRSLLAFLIAVVSGLLAACDVPGRGIGTDVPDSLKGSVSLQRVTEEETIAEARRLGMSERGIAGIREQWASRSPQLILKVDSQVQGGFREPIDVPFRMDGGSVVVDGQIGSPLTDSRYVGPIVIDSGAEFSVYLSAPLARRVAPWLPPGLESARAGTTAFGASSSWVAQGVVGSLTLAGCVVSPVAATVDSERSEPLPLVGTGFLETTGGIIFDWHRCSMILVPRGWPAQAVRADQRWASVPFRHDPIRAKRPDGTTDVYVSNRRWVQIRLDGAPLVAAIDTGLTSGIFVLSPKVNSARGPVRREVASAFGVSATISVARLDVSLHIGDLAFSAVEAAWPTEERQSKAERAGVDVVIGLDVLTKYPVWLDYEGNALRFWTDDAPPLYGREQR